MLSLTKTSISLAAAGVCFLGYCVYFDRKRRSDPLFKEKLRERRNKANKGGARQGGTGGSSEIPDLKDTESLQRFFLQEVQLGEELLAGGDIDGSIEHLSNAVAVCGQPQQLLHVLRQTLPPQVFQLLMQALPMASARIASKATGPPTGIGGMGMTEDDLE